MRSAEICEVYGLGRPLGLTPVYGGLLHRTFRLDVESGSYFVKELRGTQFVDAYERAFEVERLAIAAGVPAPRPVTVQDTDHCVGVLSDGCAVRVHEWVVGEVRHGAGDDAVCEAAGRMLAAIHGLRLPTTDAPFSTVREAARWTEIADRIERAGHDWHREVREFMSVLADAAALAKDAQGRDEPAIRTHTDVGTHNLLISNAGVLLIDWDNAGAWWPSQELASTMLDVAGLKDGHVDADRARRVVASYRAAGGDVGPASADVFAGRLLQSVAWVELNLRRMLGERVPGSDDPALAEETSLRWIRRIPWMLGSLDEWSRLLST